MEEATENWKFKLKFIWYYINNFCLTRSNILCFLLVSHVSFEILAVDNGFGYTLQSYSLSCAYYGWSTFKRWSIKTYSSKFFWSLHVITNKITCYLLKSFSHVSYPICMLIGFSVELPIMKRIWFQERHGSEISNQLRKFSTWWRQ